MTGPGELTLGSYNVWIHAARNTAQRVESWKASMGKDADECRVLIPDFNSRAGVSELDPFLDGCQIVNALPREVRDTFRGPVDPPSQKRAIDNIIVSEGVEVIDWAVIDSALSDHNPIKATLRLG